MTISAPLAPLIASIVGPLEGFGAHYILPVAALLVFVMGAVMFAQALIALIRGQTHVVPAPILIAGSLYRTGSRIRQNGELKRRNADFKIRFSRELKQREYREWCSKQSKGWL